MANIIYVGSVSSPLFTFTDDQIMSITNEMSVAVIGDELSADVFEFEVAYNDEDGTLRALPYATKLYYYQDTTEIANYWFTNITRIGKTRYHIYATSFVGLLEKQPFYGGMYFGKSLSDVVTQIVASDGIDSYLKYRGATFSSDSGVNPPYYGVFTSADGKEPGVKSNARIVVAYTFYGVASGQTAVQQIAGRKFTSGTSGTPNIYVEYYNSKWYASFRCRNSSNGYRVVSRLGSGTWNLEYGTTVEIDARPKDGILYWKITKADGTTSGTVKETFTAVSYEVDFTASTWGSASSAVATPANGQTYASYTLNKYQVYDSNGNLAVDNIVIEDTATGKLYAKNLVTGYISAEIVGASVAPTNLLDPIAASVMSSLSYGTDVDTIPVYGWLPEATKRESLYQLIFANCLNLIRTGAGSFIIDTLDNDVVAQISADSIFDSGEVAYQQTVKSIDLTVHSYDSYESSKKIFSNEGHLAPAGQYIIAFDNAPIYGTPVAGAGITIHNYNCNVALVSGTGEITGTPYVHGQTLMSEAMSNDYTGRVVSVSDATLITYLNYENVMNRMKAYYASAVEVESSLIYNNTAAGDPAERTGQKYGFLDVFEENRAGFLSKLSLKISAIPKAVCKFVCNYLVPDASGGFRHYEILTGSGTWTVPDGVTRFVAVLVGGGTGGSSGYSGEDGDQPTVDEERSTVVAHGGMYGASGASGKFYEVEVTTPAASYAYTCGTGGVGGTHAARTDKVTSNPGSAGTDTTFGSYSSASGTATNNGFFNKLTGTKYAYVPNIWSESSGKGGDGGYAIYLGDHKWQKVGATAAYNALPGAAVTTFPGGSNGTDDTSYTVATGYIVNALGGSGGGGAIYDRLIVSTSQNGTNAFWDGHQLESGDGGFGSPVNSTYEDFVPPVFEYGCGGLGGVGGGGGGAAGCFNQEYRARYPSRTYTMGTAGQGGAGSDGGPGGDGCVIVYY